MVPLDILLRVLKWKQEEMTNGVQEIYLDWEMQFIMSSKEFYMLPVSLNS